jgi:hypothetical protein
MQPWRKSTLSVKKECEKSLHKHHLTSGKSVPSLTSPRSCPGARFDAGPAGEIVESSVAVEAEKPTRLMYAGSITADVHAFANRRDRFRSRVQGLAGPD